MVHPHRVYPRFLSEQDGPFERCLKEKLAAAFLNDRIIGRAYLARVDLRNGSGESVILGLRTSNYDGWKMLDDIASIFASIFHTAEYLDIVFLKERDEAELRKVCRPFFSRDRHTSIDIA